MRLGFDLETNGFLDTLTKIHCIATLDFDTGQRRVFGPEGIEQGIALLQQASELIGHNSICFDIPAIRKLHPSFNTDGTIVTDTLVLSRLMKGDLKNDDFTKNLTSEQFPKKLHGSHSLKAWGLRLGVLKGGFGEGADWSCWSQEMQDYCVQDTVVLHKLWQHLQPEKWSQEAIQFEHDVAEICHRIGQAGWTFDTDKAASLYAKLSLERSELEEQLQTLFPAWTIEDEFIPKRDNKTLGYKAGEPFIKSKEIQFNPNSRKHIEFCLRQKYGWKPTVFTPSGDAKIDETILHGLPFPEAKALARSFMIAKRIGMLAEGNAAWLKLVSSDGKLRHTINPLGTVTGRASSFGPNLQQVPATRAAYGKECRELFGVPAGYQLLGSDLKGIELRCLAEMLPDNGAYAKVILEGDVHQVNADAAGISRDQAKTMIYALCYGAGDMRLGKILGKGPQEGRALKERFFKANPAFATLLRQVKQAYNKRGYLYGLDGRKLLVRSEHGALNVLLQSAAALIAKKWVQLVDQEIKKHDLDATIVAWVHDEIQIQIPLKGDSDYVGNYIAGRCAEEAGRHFKFKIPIEADFSVGQTWAGTH